MLTFVGCSNIRSNTISNIGSVIDYADVLTLNGIHYSADYDQIITDDKIIETELGTIKFTLTDSSVSSNYHLKDGDATFLKANTKV